MIAAYSLGTVTNRDKIHAWSHWSKHWDRNAYQAFQAFQKRLQKAEKLNLKLKARLAA